LPIKVMTVGVGPIGAGVVRQVAHRRNLRLVAAVDRDPAKIGRDAGMVAGLRRRLRVDVAGDLGRAIRASHPDVAIVCTTSTLAGILPDLEVLLRHKVPVLSTTEELACPTRHQARLARRIDELAKRARVAVLGCGVNPGFVMDVLPIVLTAASERVTAISVWRVQDAAARRLPFQQKIGAGLTPEAFDEQVRAGRVRHVGLGESMAMIAAAMGWKLDRVTEDIRPKVAVRPTASSQLSVAAGQVAGVEQHAVGYRRGEPVIRLHFEAFLGAPESYDRVEIAGIPPLALVVPGGIPGDLATATLTVNGIPRVLAADPGLRTMRDIALPSFFGG